MSSGRKLPPALELAVGTVRSALEDRIVAVAGSVAFFALLSIPSILLVVAGLAGVVADALGPQVRTTLGDWIIGSLGGFLAPVTMDEFVRPMVEAFFEPGRAGIISVGAIIAVWSASRVVRVLIESMNVAYGVGEWRPGWRRRVLALGLTAGGLFVMAVFLPFIVIGPEVGEVIDDWMGLGGVLAVTWRALYWPVGGVVGVALLAFFYHIAPNVRSPWLRDIPGAVLAVGGWLLAAVALRIYVRVSVTEGDLGPLAAPTVLLLWLYVTSLVVLAGAELNAQIEKMWPSRMTRPEEPPPSDDE